MKKKLNGSKARLDHALVSSHRFTDILERTESISQASLEHRKSSRKFAAFHLFCMTSASALYQSLLTHSRALKALQKYHNELQEKERTLADILTSLKNGYNPNYQDMAVLEAVRGWESYSSPTDEPVIAEVGAIDEDEKEDKGTEDEGEWTEDQIKHQLDGLLSQNYESLLIEHDDHIARQDEESGSVCASTRCVLRVPSAAECSISQHTSRRHSQRNTRSRVTRSWAG